ncbi:MAG: hypothetical protein IGBAC_1918 [Ignavibacteriae bacterium]|nr:MAG: hypothetical protein IGBAC_1918 [Ignavibacteriota bacterium]
MKWIVLILITIFLSFIFVQYVSIRRLKSKKGQIIDNIDGELGKILLENKKLMLYFWTESCRVCKHQTPIILELKDEFKNIFLINLSDEISIAKKLGIMAVPTIMLVESRKILDVMVGAQDINKMKQILLKFYGD